MSSTIPTAWCQLVPHTIRSDRWFLQGIRHLSNGPTLGYLFELEQTWLPNSKLSESLNEVLTCTPYDLTEEPLVWFEKLLSHVNETLQRVSHSGETDWIGTLNGLIVFVYDQELHFSQTGRLPAYLLQRNRIRQITDTVPEVDPHPTSTFLTISSGDLRADDVIICGNLELYRAISLDALRRIMAGRTPNRVCASLARELRATRIKSVAAFCLSVGSLSSEPEELLLEHAFEGSARRAVRVVRPILKKAGVQAIIVGQQGVRLATQHARTAKAVALPVLQHSSRIAEAKIRQIRSTPSTTGVIEIIHPTTNRAKLLFQLPKLSIRNRRPLLLLAALAFAGIGILTVRHHASSSAQTITVNQGIDQEKQAGLAIKDALIAHDLHQDVEATRDLSKATSFLTSLTANAPSTIALRNSYTEAFATVSNANLLQADTVLPLPSDKLAASGGWLFGVSNGIVQAIKEDTLQRIQMGSSPATGYTDLQRGNNNTIFALAAAGGIDRITPSSNLLLAQPLSPASGTFSAGTALATYQDNLYILDPTQQTFWKYIGDATSYRAGTPALTGPFIHTSIGASIDGSIYLLSTNGTISKYAAGKQITDFALSGISPALHQQRVVALIANITPPHIYILSNPIALNGVERSQLLLYTDHGIFEQAYILPPELDEAKSLALVEDGKTLWIGTSKAAYRFSLK